LAKVREKAVPFLIYDFAESEDHLEYTRNKRTTKIPRILKSYVGSLPEPADEPGVVTWHRSQDDLLQAMDLDSTSQTIIVDLKPGQKGAVSLYRVSDIWGYSGPHYTPVLVRLTSLYVDHPVDSPKRFKRRFTDSECTFDQVHEFLYLRFGHKGGTANWGRSGFVNAALLWPYHLEYFMGVMSENLEARGAES